MTYTKKLKIGLLLTTLITVLIISELLPSFVTAIIFLLGGIGFSYLLAADEVKEDKIKQMSVIIKAVENISSSTDKLEILQLLEMWVKRLVSCDECYLWIKDEGEPEKFKEIIAQHAVLKKPQLIEEENLVSGFKGVLYIPLVIDDVVEGGLILADNNREKLKLHHIQLAEPLVQTAVGQIEYIIAKNQEREIVKELLFTAIKAGEGYSEAMVGHSLRVAKIALLIGKKLGLTPEELKQLEYAALLHDIGQSSVFYHRLNSDSEEEIIDHTHHPLLGAKLIPDKDYFLEIREAVLYHHEHYDGTGYPEGLKYTDIPLMARIIAVADTYDAVTNLANEEERLEHEKALLFIKRGLGSWYDPLVVVAFEEVEKEVQDL